MLTNLIIIAIVAIQTIVPIWATVRVMKRDDYSPQTKNYRVIMAWMVPFSAILIVIASYFDKPKKMARNRVFCFS